MIGVNQENPNRVAYMARFVWYDVRRGVLGNQYCTAGMHLRDLCQARPIYRQTDDSLCAEPDGIDELDHVWVELDCILQC
jgi:hypothetical protein